MLDRLPMSIDFETVARLDALPCKGLCVPQKISGHGGHRIIHVEEREGCTYRLL